MSSETDEVRVWLVERGYDDRNLVVRQYATTDGDRVYRRELAPPALERTTVTAARVVSLDDHETVDDPDETERFAGEARRMADEHDPDDPV